MFLHVGQDRVVSYDDIIGIFDLDNTTVSKNTRKFLKNSEKKKEVITVSYELPKSFIVSTDKYNENKVFISPISTSTLQKRLENNDIF